MSPLPGSDPRDRAGAPALPGGSIRPGIALPRAGLPLPLLIGIGLTLALALFIFLEGHRQALLAARNGGAGAVPINLPAPPPALAVPPAPPPPAPVAPQLVVLPPVVAPSPPPSPPRPIVPMFRAPPPMPFSEPPPFTPHPVAATVPHDSEPALVIDLTSGNGASATGAGAAATAGAGAGDDTAHAMLIHNRASVIPQGAIIAAVLETPLNSDRPGLARALVAKDAHGFDGTRVLVPRGSRLIGEFKGDASPGLRRILITWTRLIRPDGVAIRIGSPVTDALGGAGVAGSVNTHFAERFASAVLQSALTIGTNLASTLPSSGTSAIYVGLPSQGSQIGQQLVPNTSRPPTIKVREGAEIAVMVARDLDFSGTPAVR